jgi:hypothetical protein
VQGGVRAKQQQQQKKKKKDKMEEEDGGVVYLDGPLIYSCGVCRTHLATDLEVVSRVRRGKGKEGGREGTKNLW